jgi:hypothetical protein
MHGTVDAPCDAVVVHLSVISLRTQPGRVRKFGRSCIYRFCERKLLALQHDYYYTLYLLAIHNVLLMF